MVIMQNISFNNAVGKSFLKLKCTSDLKTDFKIRFNNDYFILFFALQNIGFIEKLGNEI